MSTIDVSSTGVDTGGDGIDDDAPSGPSFGRIIVDLNLQFHSNCECYEGSR